MSDDPRATFRGIVMNTCTHSRGWLVTTRAVTIALALEIAPAHAQFDTTSPCVTGQNCCLVARTNSRPYRYAVSCDSNGSSASIAASMQGYLQQLYGPVNWALAAGWMANARIPGWAGQGLPGLRYPPAPPPDKECFLGQTCCAVGRSNSDGSYAWAYDGGAQLSTSALMQSGFAIVLERVSPEFCHYWWNTNVAGRGLGQFIADATPQGAIPFGDTGANMAPQTPPISAGGSLSLSVAAWRQLATFVGPIRQSGQGLLLQGGAWTNGRVVNGNNDGNAVQTQQSFDLSAGGDIYMRFSVDAGGQYLAVAPGLFSGVSVRHLSTHNSWAGSVVIPEQTPIYAHLRLSPDSSYALAIALGGYDDQGGQVIDSASGRVASLDGAVVMRFVDNYAGTQASLLIEEVIVHSGR